MSLKRTMVMAAASAMLSISSLLTESTPASADVSDNVTALGDAHFYGSTAGLQLNHAIVGMSATHSGTGYWLVASDGGIFSYGDASFHGSTGSIALNKPIVGMASTPSGNGYWLVASDGGIFSYGDASFHGSTGSIALNKPIVGMASTPSGNGYWLVASDGGIFSYGDASFHGSTGSIALNKPIVGMASTPSGNGYWLVASDGGIFSYGDASFHGSTGSIALNKPIVGMASTPSGNGYWLVASDGGIFSYGDASFHGSIASTAASSHPVVGMQATQSGGGYWLVQGAPPNPFDAGVEAFLNGRQSRVSAAIYDKQSGETYTYHDGLSFICASIVKVQIMETLLHNGATAAQRNEMVPMIEQSDNDAATDLWNAAGGGAAVQQYDHSIGMSSTFADATGAWGLTHTTAADQVQLVKQVAYSSSALSDADRSFALNLMEHVSASQRWGISAGAKIGVTVAVKNGWLPRTDNWHVNSIGWISGDGHDYVISVLTDNDSSEQYGIDTIQGVASRVYTNLS